MFCVLLYSECVRNKKLIGIKTVLETTNGYYTICKLSWISRKEIVLEQFTSNKAYSTILLTGS